jgi:hypothetical protein
MRNSLLLIIQGDTAARPSLTRRELHQYDHILILAYLSKPRPLIRNRSSQF